MLQEALGAYDFKSKRKEQEDGNWTQLDCRAYVYPLRVTEEMETWPEQDSRARYWVRARFPVVEALVGINLLFFLSLLRVIEADPFCTELP